MNGSTNLAAAPARPQDVRPLFINEFNKGEFIQLENVSKAYGDLVVMDNFQLSMKNDDRLVIIGPSGSGKVLCCAY